MKINLNNTKIECTVVDGDFFPIDSNTAYLAYLYVFTDLHKYCVAIVACEQFVTDCAMKIDSKQGLIDLQESISPYSRMYRLLLKLFSCTAY